MRMPKEKDPKSIVLGWLFIAALAFLVALQL